MELIDVYDENRQFTGLTVPREGVFLNEGQYMLYTLAILQNNEGKYLITQRSLDKSWAGGWWEISGGGVLSGETTRTAVVREVGEETGLDVSGIEPELIYSYTNVDLAHGDNYFNDIYRFQFDFSEADVVLQQEEAVACKLASWDDIVALHNQGIFLHFDRVRQALGR